MVGLRLLKILISLAVALAGAYAYDPAIFHNWGDLLPAKLAAMPFERKVVGGLLVAAGLLSALDALVALFRNDPPPGGGSRRRTYEDRSLSLDDDGPSRFSASEGHGSSMAYDRQDAPATRVPPPGRDPEGGRFAAALASGDRLRQEGRLEKALDPYKQALALAREGFSYGGGAAANLALALRKVAEVHDHLNRPITALPLYEEAVALRRALSETDLSDETARRDLFLALESLADCQEGRGFTDRALPLYREAEAIARSLGSPALESVRRRIAEASGNRRQAMAG